MKLVVSQSCEQGTPAGVMKFRRGSYVVEEREGKLLVNHDPRGKVTQTLVDRAIIEKMTTLGVANLEG